MDLIINILNSYWNNSIYQLLFYFALIIIFFIEKESLTRNILLWMPLLVFLTILNPVSIVFERKLWGDSINYFCRQLSLACVLFTIAYAGVLIVKKLDEKKKLIVVLSLSLLFVFSGTLIYNAEGYEFEKSDNFYKIPDDLIQICDKIESEREFSTVATPIEFTYLVRQYNPKLYVIVDRREVSPLASNLVSSTPNVPYVISNCIERGANYVVVKNNQYIKDSFEDCGYSPTLETDSYLLYFLK